MKKLLVAYATKTGSTAQVAEALGKSLSGKGLSVEVRNMRDVASLDGYAGAALGAPINGMRWMPEGAAFVSANATVLRSMPVALFYLSYIQFADGRGVWKRSISKGMDEMAASIGAFSVGAFGGKLSGPFPAPARFIFGTRKDAPADLRDWDAIRAWADEIAPRFRE